MQRQATVEEAHVANAERRAERERDRERLIEYQAQANDAYDQTLFKLSGGALGLSFVFVRQFVADGQEARMLWALGLAWFLWIVSLMCVLASFYTSGLAMDEAVRQHDENETSDGGKYTSVTRRLNAVGGIAFVAAASLAGLFMISNLGGNQMRSDKSDPTTAADTTGSRPETRPAHDGQLEHRGRTPPPPRPQPVTQTQTTSSSGSGSGSSGTGPGSGRSAQQR